MPVRHPFLPVQRQAFLVDIPRTNNKRTSCLDLPCHHGKCVRYFNNTENMPFRLCESGWSGRYCDLPYNCLCSSDSLCLDIAANNRSICLCPSNLFGPRCLLTDAKCYTNNQSKCQNSGRCIPNDDYLVSNELLTCVCRTGYTGHRCETIDSKLVLSFDENIIMSQSIFIHFFEHSSMEELVRSTTFRSFPLKQNSIVISWSQRFHLVFIELFKHDYYLIVRQNNYNRTVIIEKTIRSSDRCSRITELFNKTFSQWNLLCRMKYYHLPCQKHASSNLSCFYDDEHLCLCYLFRGKRLTNCFPFNHHM